MADYKGLQVKFEGDSTSLSAALHKISTDAQKAQGELTGIGKGLQQNPTSLELMRDRVKETGNALEAAKSRVDQFKQGIQQAEGVHKNLNTALSQGKDALKQYVSSNVDAYQRNVKSIEEHKAALESDQRSLELIEQAGQRGSSLWEQYSASIEQHKAAIEQATTANEAMDQQCMDSAQQFQNLSSQIQDTDANIAQMVQEVDKGSAAIEDWANKLSDARVELSAMEFKNSGIGQFANNLVVGGNAMSNIGDKIWGIEKKVLAVAGISAMTFGRNMISDVEEYGNSISQLGGYLEIGGEQLEHMSDLALYWGKETQFSATEASSAMGELAKGGLTQAQIEGGAMAATMNLAAAGGLDMASSAEIAVQAIKTFGLSAEDSADVADALAGAANKSTAEITDLAQGFKYVGGWASMVNWDINDVSGALALLADHGLRGEMAGTALRNVMQRLGAPTDKAAEVMEQYGIKVRDSSGQMKSAVEIVDELNGAFAEVGNEEKQNALNTIFGARALPAAIALMNEGSDSLQEYIDATDQAGYAAEMAQNRMSDMGWALEYLRGEAETASVNLGKVFEPMITSGAHAVESVLESFNSLTTAEQTNVVQTGLMVAAFGPALSIFGRVASGVGTATLSIGGFIKGFSGLGPEMSLNAKLTEGFATSMITTGASTEAAMTGATAAVARLKAMLGGIGIVAATMAVAAIFTELAKEAGEAQEQTRKASDALADMERNSSNLNQELSIGAHTLGDQSDAAYNAKQAYDDFVKSIEEHNARNEETRETARTSIEMLGQYKDVIDRLAGAGSASAEDMALLEWALDGLKDVTGETYTVEQVLTDQFLDEAGAAQNTKDAIDGLIASKQMEARVDAYKEMYTDTLKEQLKAEEGVAKATEARNKYIDESIERYKELGNYQSDEQVIADLEAHSGKMQELNRTLENEQKLYDGLTEEAQAYADAMGNAEREAYELEQTQKQAAKSMSDAWSSAAESMGTNVNDLKEALSDAGVSTEQLSSIGGNAFAVLAAQAGGDIDTLIGLIANYNAEEFEDKYGGVYVDDSELKSASGLRIEWNGEEFVYKDTVVTVNVSDLLPAQQEMANTQATADAMHDTSTTATVKGNATDGSAETKIRNTASAGGSLSNKSVTMSANGNATESWLANVVWNLVNAQNSLHDKTVTYTVNRNTTGTGSHQLTLATGGIRTHADGGIRWHAGGSIVNAPVVGYPLDLVGEDGAEAIVPLTNKRYAQPFVDMIAEGVAGILPTGGSTYIIDGLSYLPGSEVSRHVEAIFTEAARKARM